MSKIERLVTSLEMPIIRVGIKKKYTDKYFGKNNPRAPKGKGIFSDIAFNTSRASYESLKDSFYIEIKEKVNNIYLSSGGEVSIPSTETLMKIFCKDDYVPIKTILNACLLYIDELPIFISEPAISNTNTSLYPAGLTIDSPFDNEVVPRQLLAKGNVSNAKAVWLVVRPLGGIRYWVQPIGKVESDGTWRAPIYIGRVGSCDVGFRFEIRAFVNPLATFEEGLELHSWPEAQLSSEVTEVIRGL